MSRFSNFFARSKRRDANGWYFLGRYENLGGRPPTAPPALDIEDLFWSNTGTIVHKWHHYLPIYHRYFSQFRGTPVKMLEIGVSKGGSLKLWRDYFGAQAVIFGIDIDPSCATLDGQHGAVRIGSQDDADFLRRVVAEMGGVDLVLDDGSHVGRHIRASLDVLFPLLSENGIYMIEDLHTAYWRNYDGGQLSPHNFMKVVKQLVDDIHHWYHPHGQSVSATAGLLGAVHLHDSIVVLEKVSTVAPRHSQVGTPQAKE